MRVCRICIIMQILVQLKYAPKINPICSNKSWNMHLTQLNQFQSSDMLKSKFNLSKSQNIIHLTPQILILHSKLQIKLQIIIWSSFFRLLRASKLRNNPWPIFTCLALHWPFIGLHQQNSFFSFSFHTLALSYFKKLTHASYGLMILSLRSPSSVTCVISFDVEVYGFEIQRFKTINLFVLNLKTSF